MILNTIKKYFINNQASSGLKFKKIHLQAQLDGN